MRNVDKGTFSDRPPIPRFNINPQDQSSLGACRSCQQVLINTDSELVGLEREL